MSEFKNILSIFEEAIREPALGFHYPLRPQYKMTQRELDGLNEIPSWFIDEAYILASAEKIRRIAMSVSESHTADAAGKLARIISELKVNTFPYNMHLCTDFLRFKKWEALAEKDKTQDRWKHACASAKRIDGRDATHQTYRDVLVSWDAYLKIEDWKFDNMVDVWNEKVGDILGV